MAKSPKHSDAAQDRKLIKSMLKAEEKKEMKTLKGASKKPAARSKSKARGK